MAETYSQQRRSLVNVETTDGDSLCVRLVVDGFRNANNYVGRAAPHSLVTQFFTQGDAADTTAPPNYGFHARWWVPIPDGFPDVGWTVQANQQLATGSNSIIRLSSDRDLYRTAFTSDAQHSTLNVNGTVLAYYEPASPLTLVRTRDGFTHLTLSVQTPAAAGTTFVRQLSVWLSPFPDVP